MANIIRTATRTISNTIVGESSTEYITTQFDILGIDIQLSTIVLKEELNIKELSLAYLQGKVDKQTSLTAEQKEKLDKGEDII
jgi:hypothetical protein